MLHVCLMTIITINSNHFKATTNEKKTSCVLYLLQGTKLYKYMVEILFSVWNKIMNLSNFTLAQMVQFCTGCKYWKRKVHRKKKWTYSFTQKSTLIQPNFNQCKINKKQTFTNVTISISLTFNFIEALWKTLSEDAAFCSKDDGNWV